VTNILEADTHQLVSLSIAQQELLGIVGDNAKPIDALVDHAVEHPALTIEVECPGIIEGGRDNREYTPVSCRFCHGADFDSIM
jgi:hypothetical protein